MTEAAESAGLINMVNLTYRNSPALQKAREMVADGSIGALRHVEAEIPAELAGRQGLGRLAHRGKMAVAAVERTRLDRRARRCRRPYP